MGYFSGYVLSIGGQSRIFCNNHLVTQFPNKMSPEDRKTWTFNTFVAATSDNCKAINTAVSNDLSECYVVILQMNN